MHMRIECAKDLFPKKYQPCKLNNLQGFFAKYLCISPTLVWILHYIMVQCNQREISTQTKNSVGTNEKERLK